MDSPRPAKRRLRSVLLVTAVSSVACGGHAVRDRDEPHDGGRPTFEEGPDDVAPRQSTGADWVGLPADCCTDDYHDPPELMGAGAGNEPDDYGPGGAGGAGSGAGGVPVGIR